jgi:fibronectin type 3 domain-containing protein
MPEQTYTYTGSSETVDTSDYDKVIADLYGAGGEAGEDGGTEPGGDGGIGGYAEVEADLTGIDSMTVWVGGGNGTMWGLDDGGQGGSGSFGDLVGGNGAGSTAIDVGSDKAAAGGGGGGGGGYDSGDEGGGGGGGAGGGVGGLGVNDGEDAQDGPGNGGDGGDGGVEQDFGGSSGEDGGDGGYTAASSYTVNESTVGGGYTGNGEIVLQLGSVPETPPNFSATPSGTDSIDLSWDDVADEEGYRIYRSTDSGVTTSDTQIADLAADTTSYTDTGLAEGEDYYYIIVAYSSVGESDPSPEASAVTDLTAPDGVTATVDADDQITVEWNDNTGGEDNYHVQINRDSSGYVDPPGGPTTPGANSTSASYGPDSDNSYESQVGVDSSFKFRVRAESDSGAISDWSTSGTVYTTPIPPHNPSVSRPGGGSVTINWTIQSDIENGREIQHRKDTGSGYGAWTQANRGAPGDTGENFNITDHAFMEENARYQWRLRTVAPDGSESVWIYADYGSQGNVYFEDDLSSGDLSAWSSDTNGDPQVQSGANGDAGIDGPETGGNYLRLDTNEYIATPNFDGSTSDTDLIVRAVVAAGSMDSATEDGTLEVIDRNDASGWEPVSPLFGWEYNKQGWVTVTGIIPSGRVSSSMAVRAHIDGSGGGDYFLVDRIVVSDLLHEYTTPAAPSNLSLDASTDREIAASWTNNAAFLTAFDTDYKETSAASWTGHDNVNGTTTTIAGLLDGEAYDVRTRAFVQQDRNGSYETNWTSAFISAAATTNLPAATNLTVDDVTGRYATLSWTDPSNNADGYRVLLDPDADGGYSQDGSDVGAVGEGQTQTYETTELLDGQLYGATIQTFTEHTTAREDQ